MRDARGRILKGSAAHNKDCASKMKKLEKFHLGLPILCKTHGEHLRWRLHTNNNVQCRLCMCDWQKDARKREPLKFLLKFAKHHAKKSKRDFTISIDDLNKCFVDQLGCCALSGIKFDGNEVASLDRKNSKLGYIRENIQLVTVKINKMKTNLDQIEFLKICEKITEFQRKGKK